MKYKVTYDYITPNPFSRPQTKLNTIRGIVVHWVANPNTSALANRNYFENRKHGKTDYGSAHEIIDLNGDVLVVVPKDELTYNCGSSSGYTNEALRRLSTYPNNCTYAIECTHVDWNGKMTEATYNTLVMRCADLCKEFNLDPLKDLWLHQEIVGWKDCHRYFVNNPHEWKLFKERVNAELNTTYEYNKIYKERKHNTDVYYAKFETGKTKYMLVYKKNAKVSELVRDYKADFGFNAPFFYQDNLLGDVEIDDERLFSAYGKMLKWHEFAVIDGKPKIAQIDINESQDFVVQSAPLIVENGNPVHLYYSKHQEVNPDIANGRCQRTFIWIDGNEDLNVAVTDGRTLKNIGFSLGNAAEYAVEKGAVMALNLDGGGSSILCNQDGGVNQSQNTGANERVTHHAVLVFIEGNNTYKEQRTIDVELDGKFLTRGLLVSGRTMLPLRLIGDKLGVPVRWNAQEKVPYVNNQPVDNFILYEGRSYIGVRDSEEILGVKVRYDSARRVAEINTK